MNHSRQPPPRLVPDEPLPPYAYVSGQFPHPSRDPRGHAFGREPRRSAIAPAAPLQSQDFHRACDLFNHGYYWEAHEEWEGLWQACGRQGAMADLLKGLIHLAAAGVKARENRPAGVRRHASRAAQLLTLARTALATTCNPRLDVEWLIDQAQKLERTPVVCPAEGETLRVVFDFYLLPSGVASQERL
jgi:predicted metal-dependent hydrolase